MKLTAEIEILTNATMASPRPARLIITGKGDEYECQKTIDMLFKTNKLPGTPRTRNIPKGGPEGYTAGEILKEEWMDEEVKHCPECRAVWDTEHNRCSANCQSTERFDYEQTKS